MFPESKWGVKASERVVENARTPVPKGGGVYKVGSPYRVGDRWYNPREQPGYDRVGIASWYGSDFHARKTANGEIYDMHALTAAHPTLPMPSYAYVTSLDTNRTVLVRINDRGPYVKDRLIDLSKASAEALGMKHGGTGRVRVRYAGPAPLDGNDMRERQFLATGRDIGAPQFANAAPPRPLPATPRPLWSAGTYAPPGGWGQTTVAEAELPPPAPWTRPQPAPYGGSQGQAYGAPGLAYGAAPAAPGYGVSAAAQAPPALSGWDAASYRSSLASNR